MIDFTSCKKKNKMYGGANGSKIDSEYASRLQKPTYKKRKTRETEGSFYSRWSRWKLSGWKQPLF